MVEQPETGAMPAEPEAELGDGGKKALDAERTARRTAERLLSEARDQLAEVEQIVADFQSAQQRRDSLSTRPRERLRGGGEPDAEPKADARKVADRVMQRETM